MVSSDSSVLDAKATANADKGVQKDKGHPDRLFPQGIHRSGAGKGDLPAGNFTIEVDGSKQTINFKGGTLKEPEEKIRGRRVRYSCQHHIIRKDGDTYILTLQSKKTGEKGEIRLTGDKELLDEDRA